MTRRTDDEQDLGVRPGFEACDVCENPKPFCVCEKPGPTLDLELPCLVDDMPEATYHGDPFPTLSLSSSIAHLLVNKSAAHAFEAHPRLGGRPFKPSASMDAGTVGHMLLLGKGSEQLVIVDAPDWRKKVNQEARDAARAAGKTPVLKKDVLRIEYAVQAWRDQLANFGIALDGRSEVSAFWEERDDSGHPVPCRGRFDHWDEKRAIVWDVKTSRSAHPRAIQKHIESYGYEIQAAAYRSAISKLHPELAGRVRYGWLFCEVEPPYVVTPAFPAESLAELGKLRWQQAVSLWSHHLRSKTWPGYVSAPVRIEASPWAMRDAYEEEETA